MTGGPLTAWPTSWSASTIAAQPFVSLSSVLRGTRPNPSLGQIAKGAASLLFGSAATERLRT